MIILAMVMIKKIRYNSIKQGGNDNTSDDDNDN